MTMAAGKGLEHGAVRGGAGVRRLVLAPDIATAADRAGEEGGEATEGDDLGAPSIGDEYLLEIAPSWLTTTATSPA